MQSTPTKKGLATSTPINSFYDSGYFENSNPSHFRKTFFSLSPLHENKSTYSFFNVYESACRSLDSPKKVELNSAKDSSGIKIELSPFKVVKQLCYDDSGFVCETPDRSKECKPVTVFPLYPWSCSPGKQTSDTPENNSTQITNGTSNKKFSKQFYKNKLNQKVDFLDKLKKKNCHKIVSNLLSYFPAEDLCRMKCVSKVWRDIILKDTKANGRSKEYLKNIEAQRENLLLSRSLPLDVKQRYEHLTYLPKLILQDISNSDVLSHQSPKSYNTRFESFLREGKNLQNQILMKCPLCSYAAKVQEGNSYICTECMYIFCKNCSLPFVKSHQCPMLEIPTLVIGSKKCKKNLRRL